MTIGGEPTKEEILAQANRVMEANPEIVPAKLFLKSVMGYFVYQAILRMLICHSIRTKHSKGDA